MSAPSHTMLEYHSWSTFVVNMTTWSTDKACTRLGSSQAPAGITYEAGMVFRWSVPMLVLSMTITGSGCWPQARTQARPNSAHPTWQPSNTVTVSTAGRLQPDIGAGYRNNRQDILSYTCPQVTLTLSPVPLIFPAAHRRWSYWVRPYSNCYATMSSSPTVRPPRPLCCLLWLCSYLSCFWSTPNTHSQVWLGGYLIHPWSTPTTLSHPSASCGYLTYPWRMPTTPALLPDVATWLLTHPSSTPTTPTSLPLPAVATWLSHLSLEYAHHAQPGVAISPIPGVRPPRPPLCLCQLWLRGYLTYPWSTHTTHSQVWLCGYLTHPWSTPSTPTSLPLPAVATWLSHLSRNHAHHAHPSTSCGYVASHQSLEYAHHAQPDVSMSPIPGVRPPRPPSASCGYVAISLIPGACLPRPLFYQLWLCGYATKPWSTPNAPSHLPGVAMRPSPVSLEYARHAHPLSAAAMQLSHLSLKYTHPTASCGYTTSHLALEYAHHAQPAPGVVAMWPSHFSPALIQRLASLPPEYALRTQPFRQLWLPFPLPPALS